MKTQKNFPEEFLGVVAGHRDGHGFISREDGGADIYLAPNEMRAVLHKDKVKVLIVRSDRRGRPEGRVTEIVERSASPIIGRLLQEGGAWLVAPEDKRYGQDVLIPRTALAGAKPGQVVVVELTEPPALYGQPVGRVCEVLGEVDDPGMEIEIAVRKYGVPHAFSEAALAQARGLPEGVRPDDHLHRIDLTDVNLDYVCAPRASREIQELVGSLDLSDPPGEDDGGAGLVRWRSFQLKTAGRHAYRLGKFGFELLRHPNQRAIASGDKALAAAQRFTMQVDKTRSAGHHIRDRRRQMLQFGKIALLLSLAGFPLAAGNYQRHQQQIQHRGAKSSSDKPHALDAGIDIQHPVTGQRYRALRVGGHGKDR